MKSYAGLHCNNVEVQIKNCTITIATTLEDSAQTFEKGIQTSDSKDITGNLEKEYLDAIDEIGEDKVDIFHLYGTDGIGGVAKYCYTASVTVTPTDLSGADSILEMTVSVIPSTAAKKVTDDYVVVDNKDGSFTVTKAS